MSIFSSLFKCKHKTTVQVYSIEYPGDIQWDRSEYINAYITTHTTIKPVGKKFLVIDKCTKCGQHRIGLSTSQGYAPIGLSYVQSLFQDVAGKTPQEIIEELGTDGIVNHEEVA